MIEHAMTDLDDTWNIGGKAGHFACLEVGFEAVEMPLTEDDIAIVNANWGSTHDRIIWQVIAGKIKREPKKWPLASLEALMAAAGKVQATYQENLMEKDTYLDHISGVQGAAEMAEAFLSAGRTMSIQTGVKRELVERVMVKIGMNPDWFKLILTSYEAGQLELMPKPEAAMARHILGQLAVKPERSVGVGDHLNDFLMYQAAGMVPVVVLTGHMDRPSARLHKVPATNVIEDISQLGRVVERLEAAA